MLTRERLWDSPMSAMSHQTEQATVRTRSALSGGIPKASRALDQNRLFAEVLALNQSFLIDVLDRCPWHVAHPRLYLVRGQVSHPVHPELSQQDNDN